MIIAGLTGGLFNPVAKWLLKKWSYIFGRHTTDPSVMVAEIKKDEHTEENLWHRIESLEKKLNEEVEKRIQSESAQNTLRSTVESLKQDRVFFLSRYIHLKKKTEQLVREVLFLREKLKVTNPQFDKDYPKFSTDVASDTTEDRILDEIIQDYENSLKTPDAKEPEDAHS
jgi:vacuolar-type H+-ATPase subunit I/STV1